MSRLGDKQARFTVCINLLSLWAHSTPQADGTPRRIRDGYAYRNVACNDAVRGNPRSLHTSRLARDLILDFDIKGKWTYQRTTKAYAELGAYWKALNPLARWGGDFSRSPDGNHFSFEHGGIK